MKKTLALSFTFLVLSLSVCYAASITKESQADFTVTGSSFESTTATVEPGDVVLDISGGEPQWTTDGVSICVITGNQEDPQLIPDSNGGAIITWDDKRNGIDQDIYAQRIDSDGSVNSQWPTNGVAICTAANNQRYPELVSDGSGGAIITWYDYRSGSHWDIYAQRVDSDGGIHSGWPTNGVTICAESLNQWDPRLVSDGSGGAIITWYDYRGGDADIYAQRIDSDGSIHSGWTTNGVTISAVTDHQWNPELVSDGNGGAIITWYDRRDGGGDADIYAQRIDSDGNIHSGWTTNGVIISDATGYQSSPQLAEDGNGGAIITWDDSRTGTRDIYAQRVDSDGSIHSGWTTNGVIISDATDDQGSPQLAEDGNGGAIITWYDYRSGSHDDIYAQRVDSDGSIHSGWTADGVAISVATGHQYDPQLISDGNGGAIITWYETNAVNAQKVNSDGNVQWVTNGVTICAAGSQSTPQITSDGNNGAIISWYDGRGTSNDIYAQRVSDVYYASGIYITEKIENPNSQFTGWTTFAWTGTGIMTGEARTATSSSGLDSASWTTVSSGGDIPNRDNKDHQWIQARMNLVPSDLRRTTARLGSLALNYLIIPTSEVTAAGGAIYGPNPVNPLTQPLNIYYQLDQNQDVKIYVFSSSGELIWKQAYSSGSEGGQSGLNKVEWNGQNMAGEIVQNGVYLLKIVVDGKVDASGKIIVLR